MIDLTRREALLQTAAFGAVLALHADGARAAASEVPPKLPEPYVARGVGGGGTFVGFSMSPYQRLWFVGTDMGTLFRSTDDGASWQAVPHTSAVFLHTLANQDYPDLPGIGYSARPNVVFHAPSTDSPLRSLDAGLTWSPITLGDKSLRVRFWYPDSQRPGRVFAGLDDGLAVTEDDGVSWTRLAIDMGRARGLFLDPADSALYVAFGYGIHVSRDGGATFTLVIPTNFLHRFAGGRNGTSVVFAYVTNPKEAGGEVFIGGPSGMAAAQVTTPQGTMALTGAEHVQMAENDDVVYVAGARGAPSGTSVWRSRGGNAFDLVFSQVDKGFGNSPWPTLRPSAVGLDIGYWDGGYHTFAVNQRNSALVGGGGNFFLHLTKDGGANWLSPFCTPVEKVPGPGQAWHSTGLEDCSIRKVAFSASAPLFGVACGCDNSILITEDGGVSWRIATDKGTWGRKRAPHQSCYDVTFDPSDPNSLIAAMSDRHDFQHWGNFGRVQPGTSVRGGVYVSPDRGRSFQRLGPDTPEARLPFVSLARDDKTGRLFAGSQGAGVAVMEPSGANWRWMNEGLLDPAPIVAQLEVDRASGDVYALLGSDPSDPREMWQKSGLYRLPHGGDRWLPLRGQAALPPRGADPARLMAYPTSFALIRNAAGAVTGYFLTDAEHVGNYLATGLWRSDDAGASWRLVQQYTFCQTVIIDPRDRRRVYLSGDWQPGWGAGGAMFSVDGGETFQVNKAFPLQYWIWSVTPDPNDAGQIFYSCFGGGIRHGPKPLAA
jgi:photosystem II stability/assembly factor-like uncharacterized protein